MYAVIEVAGKQYKVSTGAVFYSESFEIEKGASVNFKVLAKCDDSGFVAGSSCLNSVVSARVLESGQKKKVVIFKYKAKKNCKCKKGHRQSFTKWEVTSVN